MFFNWLQQLGNSTEFEDVEFMRFDKYLLQVNDLVEANSKWTVSQNGRSFKVNGQLKWTVDPRFQIIHSHAKYNLNQLLIVEWPCALAQKTVHFRFRFIWLIYRICSWNDQFSARSLWMQESNSMCKSKWSNPYCLFYSSSSWEKCKKWLLWPRPDPFWRSTWPFLISRL